MIALSVIAGILLVLFLIGLIRVGAHLKYSEQGLFLWAVFGAVELQVLPPKSRKKERAPKAKKIDRAAENQAHKPKRSGRDTVSLVMEFLPLVGDAAGRFNRKIRIDQLLLHIVWGAEDPAAAAKGYGAGHAALGIIWPIIEHNFKVKDYDLRVNVDFDRDRPEVLAEVRSTLTVGQSVSMALCLGFKALKIYLGYRRDNKEQKAVSV